MTTMIRTLRAPRGTSITCQGWGQEAALRMLMNNLDPDVAERPEDLVVYGGTGKAARSWEAFDAIVRALTRLAGDETLLIQSGKPVGVFRTHAGAPRVLIANANLVPKWATWDTFRDLEDRGLTMYGQMTAGSWIYIGSQGIVQGTYETLAEIARRHFGGSLTGKIVVTAGLGGMGGAQPLAITMNGGVGLIIEVDPPESSAGWPRATWTRRRTTSRVRKARNYADRGVARSIGLLANAAEVLPQLVERGFVPDIVTDQTSAHDPLVGYIPDGLRWPRPRDCAKRSRRVRAAGHQRNGPARGRDARVAAARRRGVRLRQQHPRASGQSRVKRRVCDSRLCAGVHSSVVLRGEGTVPLGCAFGRSGRHLPDRPRGDGHVQYYEALCRWLRLAQDRVAFQGLPARICWLGYGDRARFGLKLNELVRTGVVKAPIVIGRDHLDTGSVASPNRETEGMLDGSDAIADWPNPKRAPERLGGRHLGNSAASRRRCRYRLLDSRRHGDRRRWIALC